MAALDNLTPEQRAALAKMPPQIAQQIIERLLGAPSTPPMQGEAPMPGVGEAGMFTDPYGASQNIVGPRAFERSGAPLSTPKMAPTPGFGGDEPFDPNLMEGIGVDPRGMFWQEGALPQPIGRQPGGSFAPGQEFRTAQEGDFSVPTVENLTGEESKSIIYYKRGIEANQELNDPKFETALTQWVDNFAGNFGGVGRLVQDAEYQVADRAAQDFLAAVLRKDTGAAITSQEFEMYGPMFLPMPGDKPELLEAKRRARKVALDAIAMGLGDAGSLGEYVRNNLANESGAQPKRRRYDPNTGTFVEVK